MATPGDTPLHIFIQTCQSLTEFNKGIDTIAAQSEYGLMPNNDGKLPLELIDGNDALSFAEKKIVARRLLNIALAAKKTKPLSEPINYEDVIKQYPNASPELHLNLKHACEAINEVRRTANTSTTHPDINGISHQSFSFLIKQRRQKIFRVENAKDQLLLNEAKIDFLQFKDNLALFEIHLTDDVQKKIQLNSKMTGGSNNCVELAEFVAIFAKEHGWNAAAYRYKNQAGDHFFNLFSTVNVDTLNLDPATWPEEVAVADAWSGSAYPANTYLQNLGDHKFFVIGEKIYNLITRFNPHFNKIGSYITGSVNPDFVICAPLPTDYPHFTSILSKAIDNASSAREKFLFAYVIKSVVMRAIADEIITDLDIGNLINPTETLKKYFSSEEHCLGILIESNYLDKEYLTKKIQSALDKGVDPNQSFMSGYTPLMRCVNHGLTDAVDLLLSNKADPNKVLADGTTVLFIACKTNREEILELLIERCYLEIVPCVTSEQELLSWVDGHDQQVLARMQAHIARQIQHGKEQSKIAVSPYEIARIMGHTDLLPKLLTLEHDRKLYQASVVANQSTLFRKKIPQTQQSMEHLNSTLQNRRVVKVM